ncbi:MAG: hypothetical protein GY870_16200, partial [archaeon]|nr:hypothetical protein [archaeon]
EVSLSNLTCPNCGALYCQYCGAAMDMMNPSKCPRCGGAPYYTPAKLVLTKVEDLPPEERFWEELPNCPKCAAAVQNDWDDCPFCNTKLSRKPSMAPKKAEINTNPSEIIQTSGPESDKEARRRIREERKKKSISGI